MPDSHSMLRYMQVADMICGQIAAGTLKPGSPAPSAASLARATGYSVLTCRKALVLLIKEGTLYAGPSANARARVGSNPAQTDPAARAAATLSAGLASRRPTAGLTQLDLGKITGYSETTIGHAETGRLWQSRTFWETADKALSADGNLVGLYDACNLSDDITADPATTLPLSVTIIWPDGRTTTVHQPPAG